MADIGNQMNEKKIKLTAIKLTAENDMLFKDLKNHVPKMNLEQLSLDLNA